MEGGSQYSDCSSHHHHEDGGPLDLIEPSQRRALSEYKEPYDLSSSQSRQIIRVFFKKAFDFKLKKNEMPRALRKIEYIYMDIELKFRKLESTLDSEIQALFTKGLSALVGSKQNE